MTTDMTAPATKQDIAMLMEQMAHFYDQTHGDMHEWKEQVMFHFDVAVENIRHDLLGANRDDISNLKDRVTRLEVHTRLHTA